MPEGSVLLAGTSTQNQTFVANVLDNDGLLPGAPISYQWQQSSDGGSTWVAIAGATAASLTFAPDQAGKRVRAAVSYVDALGNVEAVTSAASAAIANVNDVGLAQIIGTPVQGQTLRAGIADADGLPGGTVTYGWQQLVGSTWSNISGATGQSYTLQAAQVGRQVRVRVTYSDPAGGTESNRTSPAVPVVAANPAGNDAGIVTISGTMTQFQTLVASLTDVDGLPAGTPVAYQWQRSADDGATWVDIVGATTLSLTLQQAQVGNRLRAVATYTDALGGSGSVASAMSAVVANVAGAGQVQITGAAVQGNVLTANVIDPDGLGAGAIAYSWQQLVGSTWSNISGATGQSYTLQAAQAGRQVRVRVTYTDALGAAETNRASLATPAIATTGNRPGTASIGGTPTQGQTLTAAVADADGVPGAVTYQWRQSTDGSTWTTIAGATASTLVLGQAQVGNVVQVTASYVDSLGNSESATSPPTASSVANVNDAGALSISGIPTQGQTLTAALSDPDGAPAAIAYQWQSSDDGVAWVNLATGQSLALTSGLVGKRIRVSAAYTDLLGSTEAPVSAATAPVAAQSVAVSLFTTQTPVQPNFTDGSGVDWELGMRFVSDNAGMIQAIRYYKPASETGTHVGRLWAASGQLLANVTFTNETASGWQQQALASPVAITAGSTYTVSVNANSYYAVTTGGFAEPITNGGLTANTGAGVYNDNPGIFPAQVYLNENYFRDVLFVTGGTSPGNRPGTASIGGTPTQGQTLTAAVADADGVPGAVTYQWRQSTDGSTWTTIAGATASTLVLGQAQVGNVVQVTASYVDSLGNSESPTSPPTASSVANVNDAGALSISGIPTQGQTLTAALSDPDGAPAAIAYQWQSSDDGVAWVNLATGQSLALTSGLVGKRIRVSAAYTDLLGSTEAPVSAATAPVAAQSVAVSLFTTQAPVQPNFTDGSGVDWELGMRFVSDNAGMIQAIRYYKPASETGTHVGRLWAASGQLLANVTFTNETASGWQQQALASPVAITAGSTYTVSVNANSYYAVTRGGLADPITNGGLTANTGAGVYNDNPGIFPTQAYLNGNYFRDVLFVTGGTSPGNRPGTASIGGTPTQGQTLTAAVADADGVPGAVTYQWRQSTDGSTWTTIAGATASTLVLGQAQVGNVVQVTASYVDSLGNSESPTSPPTASSVANVNDAGALSISGIPTQGQTLTAALSDPDGAPAAIAYQWQSSDDGVAWVNLATGQSLALTSGLVGKRIRVSAAYTDLLGSTEAPVSAATAPVAAESVAVSLFTTQTPVQPNLTDGPGVDWELGMHFVSDNAGMIQAIRYYKPASETGTHVGRLWAASGQLLANVTFTNETASGWQQQALASPVAITAGSTYTVSVNANSYYAVTTGGFAEPIRNGGLTANTGAGVYSDYPGIFPAQVYLNGNYFRDVLFARGSTVALQDNATVFVSETAGFANVTVVRTGGTTGALTLEYSVNELGALPGSDYTSPTFEGRANTGQVVFADGESSKTISIPLLQDQNVEGSETFSVGIQNPGAGAALGVPRTVLVTIIDANGPAEFSFATPVLTLSEGAAAATLTIQRSGSLAAPASVTFATGSGTAGAGSDFASSTGTLSFAIGQATRTVSIPIVNDGLPEANEAFTVTLSNPVGAALGSQAVATVNILDNDVTLGNLTRQTVISGLTLPTGIDWTPDGRYMLIAQQNGIVRLADNGALRTTPLVDLSGQVNTAGDRGLLGMAIDPNFATRPYIYLLHTYDPPETAGGTGLAGPDGGGNRPARLVRLSVDPTTMVADPASLVILTGTNSTWAFTSRPDVDSTGNVTIAPSGIVNGTTIIAPAGLIETGTLDNNPNQAGIQNQNIRDYIATDSDSHTVGAVHFGPDGYLYLSVGDGTSYNFVDPRAVRAQDIHNLSGKVLRIDPATGAGVAGNPYFDPADPFSNQSKVFYSGVRNAYRFTFDPVTGLPVIGDVGWTSWEEINTGPAGSNFGWPFLEGPSRTSGYEQLTQAISFYNNGNRNNPNDVPAVFPLLTRSHGAPDGAAAITVGDFFNDDTLFFNDVLNGTIYTATLGPGRQPTSVQVFDTAVPYIVDMQKGPDGWLYGADLGTGTIRRWSDTGSSSLSQTLLAPS